MGYHLIDPAELEQLDDRPADVRSLSEAAGLTTRDDKLGLRIYEADPGEMVPLAYHYHDDQVEAFYVLSGELHVETPEQEYVVPANQALVVEPGSPHRAFNPDDAAGPVKVLAIGAPSVDDAHVYDPDDE